MDCKSVVNRLDQRYRGQFTYLIVDLLRVWAVVSLSSPTSSGSRAHYTHVPFLASYCLAVRILHSVPSSSPPSCSTDFPSCPGDYALTIAAASYAE